MHISADVQRITLNASCMTISGERTEQLDIFCCITGFMSGFLSFIDVELIRFFHRSLQLQKQLLLLLLLLLLPQPLPLPPWPPLPLLLLILILILILLLLLLLVFALLATFLELELSQFRPVAITR